ncbi:hypothetical protein ACFL5Z_01990 [Planctomycetota bacterium]
MAVFSENVKYRRISLDKTMLHLIENKVELMGFLPALYMILQVEERNQEGTWGCKNHGIAAFWLR